MWIYDQRTGHLSQDGKLVGTGYAGHGAGIDNPSDQNEQGVGPLPRGTYSIAKPENDPKLGPVAMRLTQTSGESYGRAGFFIHGDNSECNESASEGCIIMSRTVRDEIAASNDHALTVV